MLNPPEANGDFGLPKAAEKQVAYFLYFLVGLVVAGVWTLVGIGLAFAQGDFVKFVAEWQSLQAPFLIGLGTCLLLMAKSDALTERAARLAKERLIIPSKKRTWLRITI